MESSTLKMLNKQAIKKRQLSVRVDDNILEYLVKEAIQYQTTLSAIVNTILKEYMEKDNGH